MISTSDLLTNEKYLKKYNLCDYNREPSSMLSIQFFFHNFTVFNIITAKTKSQNYTVIFKYLIKKKFHRISSQLDNFSSICFRKILSTSFNI